MIESELIIDLRKPVFAPEEPLIGGNFLFHSINGCSPHELTQDLNNLNNQQRTVVKKILAARDYLLLLGMPGTGKSSTLAVAVRCLVSKGYRVLITSYTHSAVDTLLSKLDEVGMVSIQYYTV